MKQTVLITFKMSTAIQSISPATLGAMSELLRLKFTTTRPTYNRKDETDVRNCFFFSQDISLTLKDIFLQTVKGKFYFGYFLAFPRGLSSGSDEIQLHINHFTKYVNARYLKLTSNLIKIWLNWILFKISLLVNLTVKVSSVLPWNDLRWRQQNDKAGKKQLLKKYRKCLLLLPIA